jgi:MFS superfamily sulfate permease-like transporter
LDVIFLTGWIVSFVSEPVSIGYTAGASTVIISSQVKGFFGIPGAKGDGFIGYWTEVFRDVKDIHWEDAVMGVLSFIALLSLRVIHFHHFYDVAATHKSLLNSLSMVCNIHIHICRS